MHSLPKTGLPAETTSLTLWGSLRMELRWIYEGQVHPANRRQRIDHTRGYWVWLLQKGEVSVTTRSGGLRARAGQWLVSPQGVVTQNFSDDARILSLHFTCQWPSGENLFSGRDGLVLDARDLPALETSARELLAWVQTRFPAPDIHFSRQPARYSEFLRLQTRFHRWLDVFADMMQRNQRDFRHVGGIDDRLMRAAHILNKTSMEQPFPIQIIREETGLSRSHLDRLFYQSFGATTRVHWDRRRLETARAILGTTRMPVKETAFRLGFRQASHFTKWFRNQAGLAPVSYRKKEYSPPPDDGGRRTKKPHAWERT